MHDILLLCDDLIFTSRIAGVAKDHGATVRAVKTMTDLLVFLQKSSPACVILDLQTPGLVLSEVISAASAHQPKPTIVGYGSHVETAALKQARDAGCDVVWPRSKFAEELPSALAGWLHRAE